MNKRILELAKAMKDECGKIFLCSKCPLNKNLCTLDGIKQMVPNDWDLSEAEKAVE